MEPPEDVDPRDLDPEVRSQLRTLSKQAAERVARHLVAAGRLVDEDPVAALAQARAARAVGARVAVVRQAVGETAYAAGEWAEAIAELRTARRMTGDDSALPLLADAERALGRPDRALRLAQSPEAQALPPAVRVELRIVEAGARRDLGQLDAALLTLQDSGLDRRTVEPWSARLWYAFADLLVALGRTDEAREWFAAAVGADQDGATDADERILELDGIEILVDDDVESDEVESGDVESGQAGGDQGVLDEAAGDGDAAGDAPAGGPVDGAAVDGAAVDSEGEMAGGGGPGVEPDSGVPTGAGMVAEGRVVPDGRGPGDGPAEDGGSSGGGVAADGSSGGGVTGRGPSGGGVTGGGPSGGRVAGGGEVVGVSGPAARSGGSSGAGGAGGSAEEDAADAVDAMDAMDEDAAAGDQRPGWEMRFSSELAEDEAVPERPPAVGPAFSDSGDQPPHQ